MRKEKTAIRTAFGVAFMIVVMATSLDVLAQSNTQGWIYGKVTESGAAGVAGATVTATSISKGVTFSTQTSASGNYRFNALEPGSYNLLVDSNSNRMSANGISVSLGSGTLINLELDSSNVSLEEITVYGAEISPVDISSIETAHNITAAELLNQPIVRDLNAVIMTAPGAVMGVSAFGGDGSNPNISAYGAGFGYVSVGGSSVAENSYYINGFNVTNARNGLGSSTVPFQFYDQFQIKEGGYSAEFGRSIGGAINTTTKSGTNEWKFGAGMYYEPESLRGTGSDSPTSDGNFLTIGSIDEKDTTSYYVEVGGPIIRDKLFFYGIYQARDREFDDFTNSQLQHSKDDDPFWGAKIDWNITDNHLLEFTGFSDQHDTVRETLAFDRSVGFGYDGVVASRGVTIFERGGDNYIVNYTGHLSDTFTLSAMYGKSEYTLLNFSAADPVCPYILDFLGSATQVLGCSVNRAPERNGDKRDAYRLDMVWDIGDSHRLKFGYDFDKFVSQKDLSWSGYDIKRGGQYWAYFPDPGRAFSPTGFVARERNIDLSGSFDTTAMALYLEDEWQVTDKLMLRLGARAEEFENLASDGTTFIKLPLSEQIAPRLGFSWDVNGDGRSKVYGSYGKYYMPVASSTNVAFTSGYFYIQDFYELISINADGTPVTGALILSNQFGDGSVPKYEQFLDQTLEPMSQIEYIFGYEREMFDGGWLGGLRLTYRDLEIAIEDINIDASVIERHPQAAPCYDGFRAYVMTNPGSSMTVATEPACDGVLVTESYSAEELGFPAATRTYKALTLYLNKVWDGEWSMNASYVYSSSKGNHEGYTDSSIGQADGGLSQNFDQRGLLDHASGNLPNSRDHQFKLYGNYEFLNNFMGGVAFTWSSGRPLNSFGVHPTDPFAALYGNYSFYTNGQPTPRGFAGEGESIKTLDLMLKYDMSIGQRGNLTLKLDVFNVFNWDGVTEYDETAEQFFGGPNDTYLLPRVFQAERSMRLGVYFDF